MPWIDWIDEPDAEGLLADLYQRYRDPTGIDHILKIHSLNPPSLEGHARYYAQLMRGPSDVTRAEREMIAVVVSRINECDY